MVQCINLLLSAFVQAIRTVFNVAVGADSGDMQKTARNALLQMLNTVLKHVTLYLLVRPSRPTAIQAVTPEPLNVETGQYAGVHAAAQLHLQSPCVRHCQARQ